MAEKKYYIGTVGPFLFEDSDPIEDSDGDFSGKNYHALVTDGQLYVGTAPTDDNHVLRKQDGDALLAGATVFTSDPRLLPLSIITAGNTKLKNGPTTSWTAAEANFFTVIAYGGASTNLAGNDTYATICDITGSGYMFHAIGAMHASSVTQPYFEITVDGTVYTLTPGTTISTGMRLVIGSVLPMIPITSTGTLTKELLPVIGGYYDYGYGATTLNGFIYSGSIDFYLPSPIYIKSVGLAALRFSSSLKVRHKLSTYDTTVVNKTCAVSYILDPI